VLQFEQMARGAFLYPVSKPLIEDVVELSVEIQSLKGHILYVCVILLHFPKRKITQKYSDIQIFRKMQI